MMKSKAEMKNQRGKKHKENQKDTHDTTPISAIVEKGVM